MTLNQLNDLLKPANLARIVEEAAEEHLFECFSAYECPKVRRVCIHVNDNDTAFISLHSEHFKPEK